MKKEDRERELLKIRYENQKTGFFSLVMISVTLGLAFISKVQSSPLLLFLLFIAAAFAFYNTIRSFRKLKSTFIEMENLLK